MQLACTALIVAYTAERGVLSDAFLPFGLHCLLFCAHAHNHLHGCHSRLQMLTKTTELQQELEGSKNALQSALTKLQAEAESTKQAHSNELMEIKT